MSFYDVFTKVKDLPYSQLFTNVTSAEVERVLKKDCLTEKDFFLLLSPAAEKYIERMAQKAHQLTVQHFGKTMQLFLPLYISDYCVNTCKYCSFSFNNDFPRRKLTLEEVEKEAKAIADMGIKHIILLTGESLIHSSVSYLKESVNVLKKYFSSIGIEIQPLETKDYQELADCGIDSLTVYQEVYQEEIYRELHLKGPKRNFRYRLDTPERGAMAGFRNVNIGALLGLHDWRFETYMTGLHANYLQNNYLETEVGVSFPRMRPHAGDYQPNDIVTDKNLVQAMLAMRLFLPRAGIALSTRETSELRNYLIPLGVTKMSAASSTVVGGYTKKDSRKSQFEISDDRSVEEIKKLLKKSGYQPVVKDWEKVK
ncbi:2-iminoacetate synthase ThiH [Niallia sp. 01092]|uniref:2-iminoacetate synthase ThiH n=1 Tax=unclassified Niallia TaxID=2837522 RepID=UPI003FD4B724